LYSGVSIFTPDTRHLHYRLQELGWSSQSITLFFYSVTIGIAIIALHTSAFEKIIAFMSIVFIALVFFIYIQKQTAR
jgi:UDP-N-acetylmuramyl pentapeptide phosphotransferase/UDP-N-acetylglucosamine-1-phosphate transferase